MEVVLQNRTAEHVRIYWQMTQDEEIQQMLPSAAASLEHALEMFEESLKPGATSFGQVILADSRYVGDIWCYGIDEADEKMAMLSFCVFEKALWGKGICTEAIRKFLPVVFDRYRIEKIGAFTYADNVGSIGALKKAGFAKLEEFTENGRLSNYLEYHSG